VVFKDGNISEYTEDLLSAAPENTLNMSPSLLPSWIKGCANATLFLHLMSKPRHVILNYSDSNEWFFYPGKSLDGILLPDLSENRQQLLDTGQLLKGHAKFKNVYDASTQLGLWDCVLCHVSAHGLSSWIAPTSLEAHHTMSSTDKSIWDAAYDEEYDGLESLPIWEIVTEQQYHQLSQGRKALPTMAIATIKYDAHNCLNVQNIVLLFWVIWTTTLGLKKQLQLQCYLN
jgi:hypothetical protein